MMLGEGAFVFRHVRNTLRSIGKDNCLRCNGYAVLVNPKSSVDTVLGTTAPQPPTVKQFTDGNKNDTLSYRQDFEFFSNMINHQSSKISLEGRRAQVERIKSSATGSRRGGFLPDSSQAIADKLNEAIDFWDEHPSMFQNFETNTMEADSNHEKQCKDIAIIKRDLISVARQLLQRSPPMATNMKQFLHEMHTKVNAQLSTTLPYEPMPKVGRKVNLTSATSTRDEINQAEEDGVLLMCYVNCSVPEKETVNFCSGFAVQGGSSISPEDSPGRGELVITCAHEVS